MYDIIIVGAGPAGLSAAIYSRRANKKTLVLEEKNYGGQIINTNCIENYPAESGISGYDFAQKLYNQIKELDAEIKFEKVIEIIDKNDYKEIKTTNDVYKSKTVILATGSENRKLGLANEEEFTGKGISYCATCDGAFYRNMEVAVVGGGNVAVEDAIYLSDIVKKVYLIHRRDYFRAEDVLIEKLKNKSNVEIIYNSNVTKLIGENKLDAIEVTGTNGTKIINVSGLFIAIGRVPKNQEFSKLVNVDDSGYIISNEDCNTNVSGIFVAGDNRVKGLRQLVTATSDGAVAATEAVKYINK